MLGKTLNNAKRKQINPLYLKLKNIYNHTKGKHRSNASECGVQYYFLIYFY